ncbi:tetratricopeptide repeat protein [Patescibacteria group bacterium]|nr:tetratricopeptide repeat protein [Patescibacteria group bacterium]
MLYDVLPPTIFFISLGGILVICARVMVRMRRQEFSASLQAAAQEKIPTAGAAHGLTATQILRPRQQRIQATGSRFANAVNSVAKLRTAVGTASATGAKYFTTRTKSRLSKFAAVARHARPSQLAPPVKSVSVKAVAVVGKSAAAVSNSGVSFVRRHLPRKASQPNPDLTNLPSTKSPSGQEPREATVRKVPTVTAPALSTIKPVDHKVIATSETASTTETNYQAQRVTKLASSKPSVATIAKLTLRRRRTEPKPTPLQAAKSALIKQKYQAAENILVPYLSKNTKDTTAYMLLGQAALGLKNADEATEIYEQILTLNPKQPGIQAGLGHAAYQMGKYTRAIECLQRAHEENPTDQEILTELLTIAKLLDNAPLQHSIQKKINELEPQRNPADRAEPQLSQNETLPQ